MKRVAFLVGAASLAVAAPCRADGEPKSADASRSLADLSVGLQLASRHFGYAAAVTSNMRSYDVDGAPMLAVAMSLHPFAHVPILEDLGLLGDYASAIGLGSATRNGAEVSTAWSRFDVGARYRMRLGERRPIVLGFSIGYGLELFQLTSGSVIDPELPSVGYGFARVMLDTRVPLGPLALSLSIAYLDVLATGEVGLRVRGTRDAGVETSLGLALPFARAFEARLSGTYTRFVYGFHPAPGDAYVASGALDQYLTGQLSVAWLLDQRP